MPVAWMMAAVCPARSGAGCVCVAEHGRGQGTLALASVPFGSWYAYGTLVMTSMKTLGTRWSQYWDCETRAGIDRW